MYKMIFFFFLFFAEEQKSFRLFCFFFFLLLFKSLQAAVSSLKRTHPLKHSVTNQSQAKDKLSGLRGRYNEGEKKSFYSLFLLHLIWYWLPDSGQITHPPLSMDLGGRGGGRVAVSSGKITKADYNSHLQGEILINITFFL